MEQDKPVEFKMTIDEPTSAGHYVNFANIPHNQTERDSGGSFPADRMKILSRILTTPVHAKQLLKALAQNIALYEQQFGSIPEVTAAAAPSADAPTN
jgi:hypothetical protein